MFVAVGPDVRRETIASLPAGGTCILMYAYLIKKGGGFFVHYHVQHGTFVLSYRQVDDSGALPNLITDPGQITPMLD